MKKLISFFLLVSALDTVAQNPVLLKDVFPGNNTGTIQQIVKTVNYTFFNEDDNDPDNYPSLFRTDGTTAGTIKLDLTYPGYISSKATLLTALGNKVIYQHTNVCLMSGQYQWWFFGYFMKSINTRHQSLGCGLFVTRRAVHLAREKQMGNLSRLK